MGPTLRIAAVAVLAAVWGCFSAPSADVLFACDPANAPQCPPDYTCESDGCCHRDGSDVEASAGACNSGDTSGFDPSASGTDTDPGTSGTDTDPAGTETDTDPAGDDTDTTGDGATTGSDTDAMATSGTATTSGG